MPISHARPVPGLCALPHGSINASVTPTAGASWKPPAAWGGRPTSPGMHGGCLRRTGILVLWTLLYRGPSKHGVCDPSLSQLAAWSGCARSTVQLVIGSLEAAGIMGHVRRGLVVAVRGVARWCQWTSAYLFATPSLWTSDTDRQSAEVSDDKNKAVDRGKEGAVGSLTPSEHAALAARMGTDHGFIAIRYCFAVYNLAKYTA